MAILICESGAEKRKIFKLDKSSMSCGRSESADITISDPFASNEHFKVVSKNNSWFIEDLKSANGIEINDVLRPAAKLEHGDIIKVGSTFLRFYERDETAEEAAHEGLPQIPGYKVYERIGVGGMGEVYRASQISLDREVAIKTLSPQHAKDREFVEKFFSEAKAAGNLNHANIVQVHDVGEVDDICYICMEYVGGGDLTAKLRECDKLPVAEAVKICRDVAKGLEYAQTKGVVHCDIKPDNIMFTSEGTAKIADLGIARSVSGYQGRRKEVFGSPHYMAPEQAMGKAVDHRADLYSLGCTMFRMLAGRTPFSGANARAVMKKQVTEEQPDLIEINPECPPELADIVDFLMEKKVESRCKSAKILLKMLDKLAIAGDTRRKSVRLSATHKPQRTSFRAGHKLRDKKNNPLIIKGALALAGVVVVALVVMFLMADPVDGAFSRVADYETEQDYSAALKELEELQIREELSLHDSKRVARKIVQLEQAVADQKLEQRFRRLWNDYLQKREGGASIDVLAKKLDYISSVFRGKDEYLGIISQERIRLGGKRK